MIRKTVEEGLRNYLRNTVCVYINTGQEGGLIHDHLLLLSNTYSQINFSVFSIVILILYSWLVVSDS